MTTRTSGGLLFVLLAEATLDSCLQGRIFLSTGSWIQVVSVMCLKCCTGCRRSSPPCIRPEPPSLHIERPNRNEACCRLNENTSYFFY